MKLVAMPFLAGVLMALLGSTCTFAGDIQAIRFQPDLVLGNTEDELIGVVTTVVEDSKGNIYAADVGFRCVQKYSPAGALLETFGTAGEGPGELMVPFVMAIDNDDQLYFAGVGGRVAVWTTDGTFVSEFRRVHPGTAKSIRVGDAGLVYLATLDVLEQTTIDVYSAKGEHTASFGESYAAGTAVDRRSESFFGGGYLDLLPDGTIAFTQSAPYKISLRKPTGELIRETTEGGKHFVPEPPEPDFTKATVTVTFPPSSVEITAVGNRLLNCAIGNNENQSAETLLTLYDGELRLIGKTVLPGSHVVVGVDRAERVFLFSRDGNVPVIERAGLQLVDAP